MFRQSGGLRFAFQRTQRLGSRRRRTLTFLVAGTAVAAFLTSPVASQGRGLSNQPVTIGTSQGLPSIDPDQAATFWEQIVRPLMYSALTHYTQAGGAAVQGDLAIKWRVSPDLKTYTFTLRQGVKFSNGDPVSGDEIYKTFQRLMHPTGTATVPAELSNVKGVRLPTSSTLVFALKQPTISLPANLSKVFVVDSTTLGNKPAPVGSGPYTVSSYSPDASLTLVPNPSYYGGAPSPSKLTIENTQDNTASITGLEAGNLDAVWQIPFSSITKLIQSGGGKYKLVSASQSAFQWILMTDTTSPPFNNPVARQALSYAIDRQTISKAVFGGYGSPAMTSQPVPPGNPFYAKGLPTYTYDLKKAQQLFDQAGIHSGSTITYWSLNASSEAQLIGQILQQSLSQIGIKLNLVVNDSATWAAKLLPPPKKYPNTISPNGVAGPLPQALGIYWAPNTVGSNWTNPAFTALTTKADRTQNVAKQKAYYGQAERMFAEQQPGAIVENEAAPFVIRSSLQQAWLDPSGYPHFENLHY
jgi:peptide/nickel transport system substrate-binding protein